MFYFHNETTQYAGHHIESVFIAHSTSKEEEIERAKFDLDFSMCVCCNAYFISVTFEEEK